MLNENWAAQNLKVKNSHHKQKGKTLKQLKRACSNSLGKPHSANEHVKRKLGLYNRKWKKVKNSHHKQKVKRSYSSNEHVLIA